MFQNTPILSSLPATATLSDLRTGKRYTRSELTLAVDERATGLARRGLHRGDRVVVAQAGGAEFLISIFACWAAGFCAVAVSPALKPEEKSRVVENTGARAWLGEAGPDMPVLPLLPMQGPEPVQPDDPALILMTSGTTGIPKGVTHTLRSLAARIALNRAHMGDRTLRRSLCVLPVFFGHGLIGNCLTPLTAGAALTIWQTPSVAELAGFGPALDEHRISFFSSVPTFWRIALRVSPRPRRAPDRVHIGSAPLSVDLWETVAGWCGTRMVCNMFGMTETANWIAGGLLDDAAGRDGYAGQPWGGKLAVMVDGKVLNEGTGEVLVATKSIMSGFWNQPGKTLEAFEGNWFRSGDIGTLDSSGALVLKGRIKSEINRGGLKILAEEIDMLLERHPDIAEACAFGIDDPVSGEAVAAAVVLRPDTIFDAPSLRNWCAERVRTEAVPERLFQVAEIPRSDRGKIIRAQVRHSIQEKGPG